MVCTQSRVTMPCSAAFALFLLLAFTAQLAHGIRATVSVSNYESSQHHDLRNPELLNGEDDQVIDLFHRWVEKHGRVYHSRSEKQRRSQIFLENVRYMRSHNAQRKSYWMGLNKFSDLTHQEFTARYLGGFRASASHSLLRESDFVYNHVKVKPHVDWRKSGAVSEMKNQGGCGSCWAFATTGAVESVNYMATGQMIPLSEQELLDCTSSSNMGCSGGSMESALHYIYENGGIRSEEEYPYRMETSFQCEARKRNSTLVSIDGYQLVPAQSEHSLLQAVSMNPVIVAIDASSRDFQNYQGGVFTGSCGTALDHAVLVVGYGTSEEDGTPFWIAKNSWSTWWGDEGYIRMARLGSWDRSGLCGINLRASFPMKQAAARRA